MVVVGLDLAPLWPAGKRPGPEPGQRPEVYGPPPGLAGQRSGQGLEGYERQRPASRQFRPGPGLVVFERGPGGFDGPKALKP